MDEFQIAVSEFEACIEKAKRARKEVIRIMSQEVKETRAKYEQSRDELNVKTHHEIESEKQKWRNAAQASIS